MKSNSEFNILLCDFFNDIRVTFHELDYRLNIISVPLNDIVFNDIESEIPLRLFSSILENQEHKISDRDITI
jgi:hypothetical protein